MAEIGINIKKAKCILEDGGLVAIPTETVYGLAANALDIDAVTNIFKVKNRPSFDPLIVHTDELEKIRDFVKFIPSQLELLLKHFSPGPLTVLLPRTSLIPDLVTAGLDNVAIRIPNHPLSLELLRSLDFPLAAPSANPFGYISPTSAAHVNQQLGSKIDYILDGGDCMIGLESSIIGMEQDKLSLFRKGGLAIEDMENLVGKITVKDHSSSNPSAPGMLKSHYAPNKIVRLSSNCDIDLDSSAFLRFSNYIENVPKENQFILSSSKNLAEAAQNLFKGLRHLDQLPIQKIYIELVPEKGLGIAINDRLRRASAN